MESTYESQFLPGLADTSNTFSKELVLVLHAAVALNL